MTRVTESHLVRHYRGVKGGRDAALLDIAQDHALQLLHQAGLFDQGLVFKGGTALRKFRAGNAGRFSTDLDFAAPGEELALAALQALDGVELDGFSFGIQNLGDDGRRGDLRAGRHSAPHCSARRWNWPVTSSTLAPRSLSRPRQRPGCRCCRRRAARV